MLIALSIAAAVLATPTSPRLARLSQEAGSTPNAEAAFWEEVANSGSPLIEPVEGSPDEVLVTFLYRGADTTTNVVLIGGPKFTMRPNDNAFVKLAGTSVWYLSRSVRRDARFTYKMSPNADTTVFDMKKIADVMRRFSAAILDPLNPKAFPTSAAVPTVYRNSVVELPGAPQQPWVARNDAAPSGTVDTARITSAIMGNERLLSIYSPPGYDPSRGPYRLLVVFDREAYLSLVPTPTILDNLTAAGKIRPHVAVFVGNPGASRNAELPCNRKFADFLATELIPWLRGRYAVTNKPEETTVAGSSYGGLASTCAGLFHSEVFGNILSQSGSYWWPDSTKEAHEWVYRQFDQAKLLPLRFYQNVGLMEDGPTPGNGPSMVTANRRLRDLLRSKGYWVHYAEFNGGHEYLNWQGTLADGLIALARR